MFLSDWSWAISSILIALYLLAGVGWEAAKRREPLLNYSNRAFIYRCRRPRSSSHTAKLPQQTERVTFASQEKWKISGSLTMSATHRHKASHRGPFRFAQSKTRPSRVARADPFPWLCHKLHQRSSQVQRLKYLMQRRDTFKRMRGILSIPFWLNLSPGAHLADELKASHVCVCVCVVKSPWGVKLELTIYLIWDRIWDDFSQQIRGGQSRLSLSPSKHPHATTYLLLQAFNYIAESYWI